MISKHLLCVLVFFVDLNCIPASETYKSIIWDPENPLFAFDTKCPYKYKRLKIHSASKIKFICPNVATVLQTTSDEVSKTNKFENLWLLYKKESFERCDTTLDINVTQPALRCDEPTQLQFHSITFQRFAALKDEPAFKKGHYYYIIATSNGKYSNINATSGGHCYDTGKNVSMRIEVYVCNNTDQVEDKKCNEGVGELTCPHDTSSSSSESTPTPSTPHVTMVVTPSATQISTPTTVATTSTALAAVSSSATATEPITKNSGEQEGFKGLRNGDSNEDSKTAWMATAFAFMAICIAVVIALILYYFCLGKKKTCQYETKRKVKPSPQYGRKNPAFNPGNDGFNSEHETGSLPDKGTGVVIYNKEVFYDKQDGSEHDKKNPPV